MSEESVTVCTTVNAPADTVFAVLADPNQHQAIDGTGWVCESLDGGTRLTKMDQIFRVAMYHANHPDGRYEMDNRVVAYDEPKVIAWEPGQRNQRGDIDFGGWIWRYELAAAGASETAVTLTYDWSAVPTATRREIAFPPFDRQHLVDSLAHLARLAEDAEG